VGFVEAVQGAVEEELSAAESVAARNVRLARRQGALVEQAARRKEVHAAVSADLEMVRCGRVANAQAQAGGRDWQQCAAASRRTNGAGLIPRLCVRACCARRLRADVAVADVDA
jgi:hypothetical protein